jgi:hypothetical protein
MMIGIMHTEAKSNKQYALPEHRLRVFENRVLRKSLKLRENNNHENGKICVIRNFKICTLHKIILGFMVIKSVKTRPRDTSHVAHAAGTADKPGIHFVEALTLLRL